MRHRAGDLLPGSFPRIEGSGPGLFFIELPGPESFFLEIFKERSADFPESSAIDPFFFLNCQIAIRCFFGNLSNRSKDFLKSSARGPLFFLNRIPPGRAFFTNGRMICEGSVGECDDYSWVGQTSGPGRADVF